MDRNLVLAIVISALIIIGFQLYVQKVQDPAKKSAKETGETIPGQKPADQPADRKTHEVPDKTRPELTIPEARPDTEGKKVASAEGVAQTKVTTINVESALYEAVLSSEGARITSFKLKDFKRSLKAPALVNLFDPNGPDTSGPSITFIGKGEPFKDRELRYSVDTDKTKITLEAKDGKQSITFSVTTKKGLKIVKTFTFYADRYLVDFSFKLTNTADVDKDFLVSIPWKKVYMGESDAERFSWNSAEILLDGQLKDYYFTKIKGDEEPAGQVEWAGLGDVYFFKALVLGKNQKASISLFKPSKEGVAEIRAKLGAIDLPANKPVTRDFALYFGPKEHKTLVAAGHNLERAQFYSEYAVLDIMSEYLMKFLRFCNTYTHNYGWAIILLTILIKILFVPLTHKSMKSMKRMQDLQPQIAKLKEKYKDDKQELNKATMEMFREHKVNPLGSCWPMFLQLPVFIALYQALSYAIELRHAPFVCYPQIYLCINDLSAPDPYYVTPILMGATMVLQQWMTPSAGDPTQRKMMLLMPVVFTYLFLSFPSGLVLYWLISNVLSIGQQFITNKLAKQ
jgi:YidC/Oxa1 family membrane protein insertase